ncbi:MAG: hypothetical protein C5B59_02410 [Bacteroidetes bacterium]|nr:MAG: hypothetical protein C5B59_02410 [Bacteroidota bacterium]
MEQALDKLKAEIEHFLNELKTKRAKYDKAMKDGEVLGKMRVILKEIRELEAALSHLTEDYFRPKK